MCNKVGFPSKQAATSYASELNHERKKHTKRNSETYKRKADKKMTPYECKFCGMWHLTTLRKSKYSHQKVRDRGKSR